MSLRGARFLAYASEQAPQSQRGKGLVRFARNDNRSGAPVTTKRNGDGASPDKSTTYKNIAECWQ